MSARSAILLGNPERAIVAQEPIAQKVQWIGATTNATNAVINQWTGRRVRTNVRTAINSADRNVSQNRSAISSRDKTAISRAAIGTNGKTGTHAMNGSSRVAIATNRVATAINDKNSASSNRLARYSISMPL